MSLTSWIFFLHYFLIQLYLLLAPTQSPPLEQNNYNFLTFYIISLFYSELKELYMAFNPKAVVLQLRAG